MSGTIVRKTLAASALVCTLALVQGCDRPPSVTDGGSPERQKEQVDTPVDPNEIPQPPIDPPPLAPGPGPNSGGRCSQPITPPECDPPPPADKPPPDDKPPGDDEPPGGQQDDGP